MLRLARPLGKPGKRGRFSRNFDIKGKKWVHNTGEIPGLYMSFLVAVLVMFFIRKIPKLRVTMKKFARRATL